MAVLSFSGHRGPFSPLTLWRFAKHLLSLLKPELAHVGMALGWDMAAARACRSLGIPYVAFVPCTGQELLWPLEEQEMYRSLLERADRVVMCSSGGYRDGVMEIRNRQMIYATDKLVALWNGSPGGTANAVEYAQQIGVQVDVVWNLWQEFLMRGG